MPRGSAPGERRGGRRKGVPNKATLKKSAERAEQARAKGLKLGVDILSEAANYFVGLASTYAPVDGNPNANRDKFAENLRLAASIAKDLAPYETPRLQSVAVTDERLDLTKLTDKELRDLDALYAKAAPDKPAGHTV